jgi:hypothetical protein
LGAATAANSAQAVIIDLIFIIILVVSIAVCFSPGSDRTIPAMLLIRSEWPALCHSGFSRRAFEPRMSDVIYWEVPGHAQGFSWRINEQDKSHEFV